MLIRRGSNCRSRPAALWTIRFVLSIAAWMDGWRDGWLAGGLFFVQKYLLNFNYCTKKEKEDGNKIQNLCANLMKASARGRAAVGGWGCFIKNCVGAEVEATAASNAAPIPVFCDVHLLLGSSRRLRQVTNSNLN